MFSIICTMLAGIVIGRFLHDGKFLKNIEKSTSLTIAALLFVLGLSIGSNRLIVENLGRVGWQAAILAVLSLAGSIVAARIVFQLFLRKEKRNEEQSDCTRHLRHRLPGRRRFQPEADMHNWSLCILYALMLQVGIGIGSNRSLQQELKKLSPKMLLVPAATITGTLAFSAAASLLLSQWSVFDCMAVGSGFAYYSLSSILITQFKEPSIGLQLATELGTIALLSNIIREMMSLVGAPLIRKYFGQLAPISAAGVNSMDVLLPSITRCSGKEVMPIAIFHGILIDLSVPFFVNLFCNL